MGHTYSYTFLILVFQGLRQRYGDNWLNSGASDTLHTLLGISSQSEARTGAHDQSEASTGALDQSEASTRSCDHSQPIRGQYPDCVISLGQSEVRTGAVDQSEAEDVRESVTQVRRQSDEVPDAIDKAEDGDNIDLKNYEGTAGVSVYGEAREEREESPETSNCTKVRSSYW